MQPEDPYLGGQLVMLVNDASRPIDVACWTVRSARAGESAQVLAEDAIPPGGYLRLFPERVLFDSIDTLSLLDDQGQRVDQTPKLIDRAHDDRLWFRQQTGRWTFGRGFRLPEGMDDGQLVDGANTC